MSGCLIIYKSELWSCTYLVIISNEDQVILLWYDPAFQLSLYISLWKRAKIRTLAPMKNFCFMIFFWILESEFIGLRISLFEATTRGMLLRICLHVIKTTSIFHYLYLISKLSHEASCSNLPSAREAAENAKNQENQGEKKEPRNRL